MCDVLEFVAKKTILRKGFQKTDKYGNQNQVYDHFQTSGSDQAIEKEGNIEGEQENKSVKEERQGNKVQRKAVVVAQLAERLLPTPEIRGSNPDIGNISNVFICQLLSRKDENKEKEAGNGPLKKVQRKGLKKRKRMVKERRRKRKQNKILKDKERNKLRMRVSMKNFQPNGLDLTNQT